ncbi:MAG: hypothetical protein AB9866_04430 [Syntrophobacteraceae bacterium]
MDRTNTAANSRLLIFIVSLFVFSLICENALAAQARLAWNKSTDATVIGYKVYHGAESGNYTVVEDVQTKLTSLVAWTAGAKPRYFAVTAYSPTSESDFSEELTCLTIKAQSSSNGDITPSGETVLVKGSSQTFSVTPAAGYAITDLLIDGVSVGALSSHTFTNVTANHTISAKFAPVTYTIAATANDGGAISPAGSTAVNEGANQVFTITPAANYRIANVKVDGTSVGALSSYTFSNVTANHKIAATFTPIAYTITASAESGGAISPAGVTTLNKGASKTFTIVPANNYKISDVKVDGTSVGSVSSHTFTNVTADRTITAFFKSNVQIVVDKQNVLTREGKSAYFRVKLSSRPSANVPVSVDWLEGDPDISVVSGGTLTFTPSNWKNYQTVILGAAPDADIADGSATIRLSAANMDPFDVMATEIDEGQCETLLSLKDTNGNASSEIAVLQKNFSTQENELYIKDSKTKSLLTRISFDSALTPRGLVSYEAGGFQKVAMLGKNNLTGAVQVEVRDVITGDLDSTIRFAGVPVPMALAVVRDLNRNKAPELAVLGASSGGVRVQIRDSVTGNLLRNITFDSAFTPKAMAVISDVKNGYPRIAVLGINPSTGEIRAELKDTSGSYAKTISFDQSYSPLFLTTVPRSNANGASGLSLLGIKAETGWTAAQLMDSERGSLIRKVAFGSSTIPRSLAVIESLEQDSGQELGLLQISKSTGRFSAVRRDAKTGISINSVPFSSNYVPVALTVAADLNANGSPELVSLGVDKSTGKARLEVRDGLSRKPLKAIAVP